MKPTTKEIDYFTHPDQAWLQELWRPAVGHWVATKEDGFLGIVVDPDFAPKTVDIYWVVAEIRQGAGRINELRWLPTLSDLLGMIEEAAKSRADADGWKLRFAPGLGYRVTLPDCMCPLQEDVVEGPWKTTCPIAAAELLKVVGAPSD